MFFGGKKIIYLNCYKGDAKEKAVGFIRVSENQGNCRMEISLRKVLWPDGDYQVILQGDGNGLDLGTVFLKGGEASDFRNLILKDGCVRYREEEMFEKNLHEIIIFGNTENRIVGWVREQDKLSDSRKRKMDEEIKTKQSDTVEKPRNEKKKNDCMQIKSMESLPSYSGNKWKQLQNSFETVYPFGDERVFISIAPKDFIILRAPYQKLVNNSFLLHGYYNYRHIILGASSGLGTGEEDVFYLGVPGTYHEREKMVAAMFGFEGFECKDAVENGKFGYYMRRVEL